MSGAYVGHDTPARRTVRYIVLFAALAVVLFPIYWMVLASLRGSGIPSTSLVPDVQNFTGEAYVRVVTGIPFIRWYTNSLIVAGLTTLTAVAFSILSGYALARFKFVGKSIFSVGVLATQLIPGVLLAIPLYTLMTRLGLLNSYSGLTISYVTKALPFSMWMLWGYFQSIPGEIEEAALVDGASRLQTLFRIVVPLSLPGIVTVGLFTFVMAWEEFLYALMIMSSDSLLTLTVGVSRLKGDQAILWGELMAYSVMMTIPTALVFMFLQRYLAEGLTAGATKG